MSFNLRHLFALLGSLIPAAAFAADVEINGAVTPAPATTPIWITSTNILVVGSSAGQTGTLAISGTGVVSSPGAMIGDILSPGVVTVTDFGFWNSSGTISAGYTGSGTLDISGHGVVSASTINIAGSGSLTDYLDTESSGWIRVRDHGVLTVGSGTINVGLAGSGTLTIGDSGYVESGEITVGAGPLFGSQLDLPPGNGTIIVGGGTLHASGAIYLGASRFGGNGSGVLKITGGSVTANTVAFINEDISITTPQTKGLIDMSGGSLAIAGDLKLGEYNVFGSVSGSMTISGGSVSNTNATISVDTGKTNVVSVSGGSWTSSGSLSVLGVSGLTTPGNARLEISGGTVSSVGGLIANSPGGSGVVLVSSGTWTNSGGLRIVGADDNARLEVTSGKVTSVGAEIGYGSAGMVDVSAGSWINSSTVVVGLSKNLVGTGTATLRISGDGSVSNKDATIGLSGRGLVQVSGGSWITSGSLVVGSLGGEGLNTGQGYLEISGSGSVSNDDATIGSDGGIGGVTVSGGIWSTSGFLDLGRSSGTATVTVDGQGFEVPVGASQGTLQITGGSVSTTSARIGYSAGGENYGPSTGLAQVSGGNWTTATLIVGDGGNGTLEISGSGHVSATSGVTVAQQATSTGALNLNGGILATLNLSEGAGAGSINFNGTIVQAQQTRAAFISGFDPGELIVQGGGAIIDSNGFNIGIQSALTGTGVLIKLGDGQLSLSGSNSYTGGTIIQAGTVQLGNISSLGGPNATLTLNSGTLDLNGLTFELGTLGGNAGTVIRSGVTGAAGLTVHQGWDATFGGSIQNGAGLVSLTKTGVGTLTLTGSSSYGGGTQVNEGRLQLSGIGTLGSGLAMVNAGTAAFEFGGLLYFLDSSNAGSGIFTNAGAAVNDAFGGATGFYGNSSAGSAKLVSYGGANGGNGGLIGFADNSSGGTAQVEIYGNGRLTINAHTSGGVTIGSLAGDGRVSLGANNLGIGSNNLSTTFSGSIYDSGSVTKVGTGTLRLSGANTYTGGTRISAGTLLISNVGSNASALGSGDVLVEVAGKLGGLGTVLGDTTIEGMLSPGNSPGSMHFAGDLLMESTAVVQMEIGGLGYDFIDVDGLLTYDGTLSVTLLGSYRPEIGDVFYFFDAASVAGGSAFDMIGFNITGYQGTFDYGTGALTISAVPEPSALALAGVALLTLPFRRRQR